MTEPTSPVEPQQSAPPAQPETDWKAEARKWEARAKENSGAATRLAELENAQKTETQKLAERAEAAERKAADAELRSLRAEIAAEKGLTPGQAKRLQGATRDELAADADELLKDFGPAKPAADPRRPVESLKSGALPASAPQGVDMNAWMRGKARG